MPTSLPASFHGRVSSPTPPARGSKQHGDVDLGIACGISGAGIFLTCLMMSAVAASIWGLVLAVTLGGGLAATAWRLARPGWKK